MTVQFRDDDTQQTAQSYALGYDALMRDDYAAAIDAFYAVVTCDPTSRVGWLGLGVSLRCNCTFETAQQVFALLLSRNPHDLDALIYRAETLLQSGTWRRRGPVCNGRSACWGTGQRIGYNP